MKKLSIFIPSLYGGGAERIIIMVANEAAERGAKVDLVVSRVDGVYGKYLSDVDKSVNLVVLGSGRLITSLPKLVKYFSSSPPDVIFSAINMANVIAILAKRLSGVKARLVISERNTISGPSRLAGFKERVLPYFMKKLYRHADAIIAISNGVSEDVITYTGVDPSKVYTIYNPIDISKVRALSAETSNIDERFDNHVIVAAGRFEVQKDYPNLLKAFAIVRKEISSHLLILGDGILRPDIEKMVSDLGLNNDVTLKGFVSNPYSWMAASDVFVLSSAWEGFGNVIVEAMACNTNVVSTSCPSGPSEILGDGLWGQLVPVGDSNALAKAILNELTNPIDYDLSGRVDFFNKDKILDSYMNVIFNYKY